MVHPVVSIRYELAEGVRTRNKPSGLETAMLSRYKVFPNRLVYSLELDDHPELSGMNGNLYPDLGLQVVKFIYLEPRPSGADFDYYLDIVRVVETGQRWVVRDLYLDILVYTGRKAEVLDTDEYLAAIAEDYLERGEAEYALTVAHDMLNKLAEHDYSLEAYLAAENHELSWLDDA